MASNWVLGGTELKAPVLALSCFVFAGCVATGGQQGLSPLTPASVGAVNLLEIHSFEAPYQAAVEAAITHLQANGESAAEFFVGEMSQREQIIDVPLWHQLAFDQKYAGYAGNPGGKCRSVEYDLDTESVVRVLFWQ